MRCLSVGFIALLLLAACSDRSLNNPYPEAEDNLNIIYSVFQERPKHLDPVRSYSAVEYRFLAQVYEPPLQYHYLKRPYELIPLTAESVPAAQFFDADGQRLQDDVSVDQVAYSVYEVKIKPGIQFQPHPAFAKDQNGRELYRDLTDDDLEDIYTIADFEHQGTRTLQASDYVYQIKRLAHPNLHSPIFGVMADYIVGFKEYRKKLTESLKAQRDAGVSRPAVDLNEFPLPGVEVVDQYTYRIKVEKTYPQLVYWLAMPFFAPMAPEVERFYKQPGMHEKNITLDWYPVGTGPFMLSVNNPNLKMILEKNPNFRGEKYPSEGAEGDREKGLLRDANKTMPFVDRVVYSLEKESIPYWNKFLQGYFDASGISSDSFDQAISIGSQGSIGLSDGMQAKGIRLSMAVAPTTFYMGFNMKDDVVGGLSERARKLRQAISIAINYEEYIQIFLNGRAIPAQSPLPPGIFGYESGERGVNPYVYQWDGGQQKRRSVEDAKKLMEEAGYRNGIDMKTGKPLVLNFDTTAGGSEDKAYLTWLRKQFQKIEVQLNVRSTDYNRFQEKMRKGNAQIFQWGWNADYPDPENFFFLLYGPNSKVDHSGPNTANYENPVFDRMFDRMKNMSNNSERKKLIADMVDVIRQDAPWIWGFHPQQFSLQHDWFLNNKPNLMANNTLKYKRVDPQRRSERRAEWNEPVYWPVVLILMILVLGSIPAYITYKRRERAAPAKEI